MRVLGESVRARYAQVLVEKGALARDEASTTRMLESFPDDGYRGEYIMEVARSLFRKHGDALVTQERVSPFTRAAEAAIFQDIRHTLLALGIRMDTFFNERSLYESGALDEVLHALGR